MALVGDGVSASVAVEQNPRGLLLTILSTGQAVLLILWGSIRSAMGCPLSALCLLQVSPDHRWAALGLNAKGARAEIEVLAEKHTQQPSHRVPGVTVGPGSR